ncbi:MAG: zinc-dependent alcohol dehydrogenase, partial [Vicinamibacteraceae bacterium]
MQVIRFHGRQDVRLHEEPRPTPRAGEVLVRVTAVGICGSDLHWFEEGGIGGTSSTRALVLGHEFAGETSDGRRVAVEPAVQCGRCEWCERGDPNLCQAVRFAGHDDDGALREWMAWPERCLIDLPEALSAVDGAMLEPLGVAIHAIDLAHIKPGALVGVFGCGPLGLLLLQVARHAGAASLFATDLASRSHRLDAARALGAEAVAAQEGREGREIHAMTRGRGLDIAIEAAGDNRAVDAAVSALRPGGRLLLVGIPSGERTSFLASEARRKGLTFVMVRRMKHT